MHILSVPSLFVTNRTGQPHGDELGRMKPFSNKASSWIKASSALAHRHGVEQLGRMKPFSNKASSWILSSANSRGAILYGRQEIGAVPNIRSTMNSTHLSGG